MNLLQCLLLGACITATTFQARSESVRLLDFDRRPLNQLFNKPSGQARLTLELEPPPSQEADGPRESAARIVASEGALLLTRGDVLPIDLMGYASVSLWLYPEGEGGELDVQFVEEESGAKFWRKVTLEGGRWQRVDVPLRAMAWDAVRTPSWRLTGHLGLFFRDAMTVLLDTVNLHQEAGKGPWLEKDELSELAFPGAARDRVKGLHGAQLLVLTDATALDGDALLRHLEKVEQALREALPFMAPTQPDSVVIIFEKEQAYRDFVPRFASYLNVEAVEPAAAGNTMQGIAASFWTEEQGTLRPAYTREFTRSLISRTLRLPAQRNDWVQRGLSGLMQHQFHPQTDLADAVKAGLNDPELRLPLEELCSGRDIPADREWQAVTLLRMMLDTIPYQDGLPELFDAFLEQGSTSLASHLKPLFAKDWAGLTEDWITYCQETYAPVKE